MIAGVSGVLLFIFMFFGWYEVPGSEQLQQLEDTLGGAIIGESAGDAVSYNAWDSFDFIDLILLLAVLVSVGLAAMTLVGASASLPVAGSALTCGVGALAWRGGSGAALFIPVLVACGLLATHVGAGRVRDEGACACSPRRTG